MRKITEIVLTVGAVLSGMGAFLLTIYLDDAKKFLDDLLSRLFGIAKSMVGYTVVTVVVILLLVYAVFIIVFFLITWVLNRFGPRKHPVQVPPRRPSQTEQPIPSLDIVFNKQDQNIFGPRLRLLTFEGKETGVERIWWKVLVVNKGEGIAEQCKGTLHLLKWTPEDARHSSEAVEGRVQLVWNTGQLLQDIGAKEGEELLHIVFGDSRTDRNIEGDYRAFISTPDGIGKENVLRAQDAFGTGVFEVEVSVVSRQGASVKRHFRIHTARHFAELRMEMIPNA